MNIISNDLPFLKKLQKKKELHFSAVSWARRGVCCGFCLLSEAISAIYLLKSQNFGVVKQKLGICYEALRAKRSDCENYVDHQNVSDMTYSFSFFTTSKVLTL